MNNNNMMMNNNKYMSCPGYQRMNNQNNQNIISNSNNTVTIYDCFDYLKRLESNIGAEAFWCNRCKMKTPTQTQNLLYSGPSYLVLIINRGEKTNFNLKLAFCETLDLSNYIVTVEKGHPNIYKLYGVVTHIGSSGASGHFMAFCKRSNGVWYCFNDSEVKQITNLQNEVLNYGLPYILFFEKC